jgi:hypothetical protein
MSSGFNFGVLLPKPQAVTVLSDNYSASVEKIVHVNFAAFLIHSVLEVFHNVTSRCHH